MKNRNLTLRKTAGILLAVMLAVGATAAEKMKALIVGGQNNHEVWPESDGCLQP